MSKQKKPFKNRAHSAWPANLVSSSRPSWALAAAALISAAVFLAYLPCINGGFVLDDDHLLTNSPPVKAPDGLQQFWCSTEAKDYWPATNTSFWIEWRLWRTNPAGYHATNLILHAAEALLVCVVLRKLSVPGAFLAALIFALHPVNVESAAWIAQRKNMTAMLFFLLSILWYLRYLESATAPLSRSRPAAAEQIPSPSSHDPHPSSFILRPLSFYCWYWLSLIAFLLAMLGKGSAAVLPALLLGTVWWLRPLTARDILRVAPFFVLAIALTCVNIWFQTHGEFDATRNAGFAERLLEAGGAIWFYLYKALVPLNLVFIYPPWRINSGNPLWWAPLLSALVVTSVLWRYRRGWSRPLLFAWGFFGVSLVPVMGFTDVGFMKYSLAADHYQHIAVIGPIALAAAGWSIWHRRERSRQRRVIIAVATACIAVLALLTWRQSALYHDAATLYHATLQKNPRCWAAHNSLGNELADEGRWQDAIEHYRQALRLKPNFAEAFNNLGYVYAQTGRLPEAIERFQQALKLVPDYANAHFNLGLALARVGRLQEAIGHYEKTLQLNPGSAIVYMNLGVVLTSAGRPQEAIEHYREALRLNPDSAELHNNLGLTLANTGKLQEAIEHYQKALRLCPDYAEAHNNFGLALANESQFQASIAHYEQALRLNPDYADAHNNLGIVLLHLGRWPEAISHCRQALSLNPALANAYYNLAVGYAAVQQPAEAVAAARKGLQLAHSQRQEVLAKQIDDWLKAYTINQSNRANRSPSSRVPDPRHTEYPE